MTDIAPPWPHIVIMNETAKGRHKRPVKIDRETDVVFVTSEGLFDKLSGRKFCDQNVAFEGPFPGVVREA